MKYGILQTLNRVRHVYRYETIFRIYKVRKVAKYYSMLPFVHDIYT